MILSLSTNKDDSHNENLLSYKNERILPSIAIAGKSNLYKAMSAAIRMICSSNNLQIDQSLMITPFYWMKSHLIKENIDIIIVD